MRTAEPTRERPVPNRALIVWRLDDLGIRHNRVAAFLGVSPAQWSRCLAGDRHLTDEQMDALAQLLGTPRELIDLTRRVAA